MLCWRALESKELCWKEPVWSVAVGVSNPLELVAVLEENPLLLRASFSVFFLTAVIISANPIDSFHGVGINASGTEGEGEVRCTDQSYPNMQSSNLPRLQKMQRAPVTKCNTILY